MGPLRKQLGLNMVFKSEAVIQQGWCSYKKRKRDHSALSLSTSAQGSGHVTHSEMVATYKLRKEAIE